ncbi:hypothetical protein A3F07_03155 [candidate division WWE3 bacterium RIFCSPHIGHO2_12_FULL_38_15]|uniref:Nudix hydrolase domain-containing protein n=1 Tax=candidate division WWE3 bacterium RIFCSPHIGHO2_02_FULL_38_14 TaxID=1802620 RepID=A0A1F4V9T3_UNCKA|nr:MAG: hypothetical protein A2793_04195 [candidate division WWE3 bacterium RIFCSPHIGHO2_01_FULL_38_45]OGC49468.1 MAG: hypothetical protein A3F07_03155 [candidate division WWE3 bacterium RIFCSPHIGHO2_12_FULL_38_15]OGC52722.1 MAG: hypothetical protein A3B64_00920 [candidate division WWE3 bacterium RIFCSPLOWO2_01_FULL_37_24]OGC53916.1 MAG: hypothetical protein A3D91_03975 [candidate division WWE3 bacterium RIFCSPHIGHO2_02_FULL_38_14]HLB52075.1 NUDIX domain-containing protein [Patescibacteria grou
MSGKQRHNVVPGVACFIFIEDKVLLIKASEAKEWKGKYTPLGGHIEKGESVIAAANREIKEESGLTVFDTKLKGIVHVSGFYGKDIMLFVTSSKSKTKEVMSGYEGELEWVKISDLDKKDILEDVRPVLKHILEMNPGDIFVGSSEFDGVDKLVSFDVKIN